MGKGVMLKKKGGENIYPVTASDLVYDPITKKNVKEELGGKVEEAPKNDKQYARVNGSWAEVEAGAVSEVALITLTPAVAELNGVSVKVTTNEGETLLDTTWNGAQLSVQVRAGLQYTVAVGSKEGFIAPQAVTYTAVKGATRSINMAYTESRLKVNLLSNQGSDSAISSVKATVKYGSTSVQVANGGSIALPLNVAVTITFPDVTGYKKPETISYTHTSGSYEKSGTYQTEVVSVTLSADNGQSVNGQIVTINGTQHTWNGTAITQKVAFGTEYTVSVNDKDGYTKPADQTFTANQLGRDCSMVYAEESVYIRAYASNFKEYSLNDTLPSGVTVNGIHVRDENFEFFVGMEDSSSVGLKYDYGDRLIPDVTIVEYVEDVLEVENINSGDLNTEALIEVDALIAEEIEYIQNEDNYEWPGGGRPYLGCLGEWLVVFNNIDKINQYLAKFGGNQIPLDKTYWTSTQVDTHLAWCINMNVGEDYLEKNKDAFFRPFGISM